MNEENNRIKEQALDIFHSSIASVNPRTVVTRALHEHAERLFGYDRITVAAIGKAAAPMARAAREILGDRIAGGIILTKYGHGAAVDGFETLEAGHPIPDENGITGTKKIIDMVGETDVRTLVLVLISGGGSALTSLPVDGLSLSDLASTNRLLIESSAYITEINTVRKHLSGFSGGRLARYAQPSRVVSFILSDVVGDDITVIASGPTAPDPTTFSDAREVLTKYGLADRVSQPVARHLSEGARGMLPETPKPGDPIFDNVINIIVGNAATALSAAEARAREIGFSPLVLSSSFSGDTHELVRFHGAVARESLVHGRPAAPPACIISGGETTMTVSGSGKGGRNTESALVFALETAGVPGVFGLFCGSDGTDGPTDAAGAFSAPDTVSRAREMGLDAKGFLLNNDSYTFFQSVGDLIITGPTQTNVMDIRLVLITGGGER